MATFSSLKPQARWFIGLVVCLGTAAIVHSSVDLARHPITDWYFYLLAILTLVSGSITLTVPSTSATISVSEAFTFTSVILFGASAGTVVVALDALIISLRLQLKKPQPKYKTFFNLAAPALSVWVAAHLFFRLVGTSALGFERASVPPSLVASVPHFILPLAAFTATYFLLNSFLVATAIALETRTKAGIVWKNNFVWFSISFFSAASVSVLLVAYTRLFGYVAVAIILPLLVISYLTYKTSIDKVAEASQHVERVNGMYLSTIEALAMAIDAGDQITHGHIRRVQLAAVALAKSLGVHDETQLKAIQAAALLHDIGKLGVPEHILNKPARLTSAEFERMKLHASKGAEILSSIEFPYPVIPIVRHHHENWDGTGYPDRLAGSEIPIGARILSVVDCYDALMSDRPYRPKLSRAEALAILRDRRATMYDPLVVDAFMAIVDQVVAEDTDSAPTVAHRRSEPQLDLASGRGADKGNSEAAHVSMEMLGLYDLAKTMSGHASIVDACDIVARRLRRMVPFAACVFLTYDAKADDLLAAHVVSDVEPFPSGFRVKLGERVSGWVGANRASILNANPALDLGGVVDTVALGLRGCLSTPLVVDNTLLGVLTLYSTGSAVFCDEHRRILETVSGQVGRILRDSITAEQRTVAGFNDQLTGLPNVARFREFASTDMLGCNFSDQAVSLLFLSVANLGEIDDTRGPGSADTVLSHVAQVLWQNLRAADIAFRYGADEFAVLLNQTDPMTACSIAERIADSIARTPCRLPDGAEHAVTVRTSMASRPVDALLLGDLASVAKARLTSY